MTPAELAVRTANGEKWAVDTTQPIRDALTPQPVIAPALIDPQANEVEALLARLEAAEKDAARYQFIRKLENSPSFIESYRYGAQLLSEAYLDAAVDAAMQQEPKP